MTDNTQQFPLLRSAYDGMTKVEKRIADYILAHPEWRLSLQTHKLIHIP